MSGEVDAAVWKDWRHVERDCDVLEGVVADTVLVGLADVALDTEVV